MSTQFEEAVGSILAIIFGGVILLKMAPALNSTSTINLAAWGTAFLFVGITCVVLLTYGMFKSLTN